MTWESIEQQRINRAKYMQGPARHEAIYTSMLKPGSDTVMALLLLIILWPLLIIISFTVLLMSGRPVFFRQNRVGLAGKVFTMYKFRTMYGNDKGSSSGLIQNDDLKQSRANFLTTSKNDPRVTPVGRLLRKAHLDELPQLINVLKGDMSFVGPRPDVEAQEADYSPRYWRMRCSVKPGITGLAQVRTSEITPRQRLASDLFYARHISIGLDWAILLKTVRTIIKAKSY